jgi:hypothetical protein
MSTTFFPYQNSIGGRLIISSQAIAQGYPPGDHLRYAIDSLSEQTLRFIFQKYVNIDGDSSTNDTIISINCFVFSKSELQTLLLRARQEGREDAQRWERAQP